jgi:hypothetical protein
MLADVGGTSLDGTSKPLAAEELAGLAMRLARAVAGMHARGVLHRDIAPANVVVSAKGVPCLVDFAVAAPLAEAGPGVTVRGEMVGTLAYLAPEATGRTGRAVDARADLYALGAVLYELATGGPPFGSGDPLRLARDHLARVPLPPDRVNPAVPAALSAVIMHLLEKDPDRRYQTADGLVADLERVREAGGRPAAGWRAGERDVPGRLLAPSRLAGRGEQVAVLEAAVLEAALAEAVAGRCAGVLVGGATGVGKTVLAEQLRPAVAARGGWFVAGKFDPVPAGPGVRRSQSGAAGAGPAAAGRAGAGPGSGPRAGPGGGGAERGAAGRGGAGVRGAAGSAAAGGGSADRACAGAARGGGGAAGDGLAGPAGGGVHG